MLLSSCQLCVVKGSITDALADAIVHPTNTNYSTGGQVGSLLANLGGQSFRNEIATLPSLPQNGGVTLLPV